MPRSSPDVSFFLISGLDVLGTLTDFEDKVEAVTERSDALGDAWEENTFTGVRKGELSQNGFYDDAAGSVHDALSSGPGTTAILIYGLDGTATGTRFTAWNGCQVNYNRLAERDALTKAKANYKSVGAVEVGKVLVPYKAPGATGAMGQVDCSASSTGAAGYLAWNATVGEAIVRIQHSSDNSSWVNLMEFTKIDTTNGSHGCQRMVTTAEIRRYVRADITTATATGSIANLKCFVGLVRYTSTP